MIFESNSKHRKKDWSHIQDVIFKNKEITDYLRNLKSDLKDRATFSSTDFYQAKPFPLDWRDANELQSATTDRFAGEFHVNTNVGFFGASNQANDGRAQAGIGARFTAPGSGIADFAALGSYHYRITSLGVAFDVRSRASILLLVRDITESRDALPVNPIVDAFNYYHDFPFLGEHGPLTEEDGGSFAYGETHRGFFIEKDHVYDAWIFNNLASFAHTGSDFASSSIQTWLDVTVALIHVHFIL
jgi:hypothetical protein